MDVENLENFEEQEEIIENETEQEHEYEQEQIAPSDEVFLNQSNIICKLIKRNGKEITDELFAEVNITGGRNDMLLYINLTPIEHQRNKITSDFLEEFLLSAKFPVSLQMGILMSASILNNARIPVIDNRKDFHCRFVNKYRGFELSFFRNGTKERYTLFFNKVFPYGFRLTGKIMNMLASIENWSVALSGKPPITVSKRLREVKPVVELITIGGVTTFNREEIFGILAWYQTMRNAKIDNLPSPVGIYFTDYTKEKNVFFGIDTVVSSTDDQNTRQYKEVDYGVRIHRTVLKDANTFKLLMGIIQLATYGL